ncbi:MAG: type II secretion system minor pseudopilin GspK [Porticoccaceae bacterium]|nr:type II secretion system minor pseudopilin GspK [Porticoccaceae bacterium]
MISAKAKKQRGVALLAAMILVLAVTMILSNIFYRHQIEVSQAMASLHSDQALLIALSGEGWAMELLAEDPTGGQPNQSDHYGEIWAQALPLLPVEGGTLTGCISDLQSKINVNNFRFYGSQGQGSKRSLQADLNQLENMNIVKTWLNLLNLFEIPTSPARAATIIDWVDGDSAVTSSWGAEQPDYESFEPPRMVLNDEISDASELADIAGYNVQEVQMLLPWISALPVTGPQKSGPMVNTPININTASSELLLALGGSFGQQFVDAVVEGRPFSDIDTFEDHVENYLGLVVLDSKGKTIEKAKQIWHQDLVSVATAHFKLYLKAEIGEAEIEVTSIMKRSGSWPLFKLDVIAREITVVPSVVPSKADLSEIEKMFAAKDKESDLDQQIDIERNIVQPACMMMEI